MIVAAVPAVVFSIADMGYMLRLVAVMRMVSVVAVVTVIGVVAVTAVVVLVVVVMMMAVMPMVTVVGAGRVLEPLIVLGPCVETIGCRGKRRGRSRRARIRGFTMQTRSVEIARARHAE